MDTTSATLIDGLTDAVERAVQLGRGENPHKAATDRELELDAMGYPIGEGPPDVDTEGDHPELNDRGLAEFREPELISDAIYRTARKPWDCQCPGTKAQPCPHPDCERRIEPGERYVEYLAEAEPYRSGSRYCLPCGVATWAASQWETRL